MATVSSVVVKYGVRGAEKARKADEKVRDTVTETAKTARSETGTIKRWQQRHKSSIQAIGAATAGVLGGILSASPTMRAELSSVRTAFSLFADTIVQDVLPEGGNLSDLVFDLEEDFRNLNPKVRKAISTFIVLTGIFGAVAVAAAGVGVAIGAISAPVAAVAAAVAVLAVAWTQNWLGIRDIVTSAVGVVGGMLQWLLDFVGADSWGARLEMLGGLFWGLYDAVVGALGDIYGWAAGWIGDFVGKIVGGFEDIVTDAGQALVDLKDDAIDKAGTIVDEITDLFSTIGESIGSTLRSAYNAVVPDKLELPEITVGGQSISTTIAGRTIGGTLPSRTIGGQSFDLPQLRSGGFIESAGLAELHAGERIVPAAEVSDRGGGGGGGQTVVFERGAIQVGDVPGSTHDARRRGREVGEAASEQIGRRMGNRGVTGR